MTRGAAASWRLELERHDPNRQALICEGRTLRYDELAREVAALADRLEAQGILAGDLAALLAPPSSDGVVLIHALLDRGVVMVPLNLRLTESELAFNLKASRARWLVVAGQTRPLGERLAKQLGCGLLLLAPTAGGGARLETLRAPVSGGGKGGEPGGESGLDAELATRREALRAGRSALVLFTSGTSGRPKGALLSLDSLRASARASAALLGSDPDDRWLLCMPLFHIGGLSVLIRSALAGSCVVLHRGFEAREVDRSLEEDGISHATFVATMLSRLLESRGATRRAPQTLRVVLLGGGPASQALLSRARGLGFPIALTYGLTEAASQVATRPPQNAVADEADLAAGLPPLPGVEIRIVDEAGESVAEDVVGEIEVRGPILMQGYLDDPEATARAIRAGWLATGDLGRLDAEGGLRVLDRRSDLIVSGGENVYPAELESVLVEHPDVDEAGVVGQPDAEFGERPLAYVVAAPGRRFEPDRVLAFCRERLAKYKVPVQLIEIQTLPRTASGKLLRRELKGLRS
jgi:O-succinylbenzoic acid--CoA ligase